MGEVSKKESSDSRTSASRPRPRRAGTAAPSASTDRNEELLLAHLLTHQLRNAFTTVVGLASVLEHELLDHPQLAEDAHALAQAARSGIDAAKDLLGLIAPHREVETYIDMNGLVRNLVSSYRSSLEPQIELVLHLHGQPLFVDGYATQLQRMLMNLLARSTTALGSRGGQVTLRTLMVDLTAEQLRPFPPLKPGSYVRLQVGDTGRGLSQEELERSFEPPTTPTESLALAIVHRAVTDHGGRLLLYSRKGLGSTVTVDLPASARDAPELAPATSGGLVLVVDDEPAVRRATGRVLVRLGYEVVEASGGTEALELYARAEGRVSLVVLDIVMPELDGLEVLARLLTRDPSARVLIYTGDDSITVDAMRAQGAVGLLRKPATFDDVAAAMRALEARSARPA